MAKEASHAQQITMFAQDLPQMPDGYYSGDRPNPNLHAFVEAHLAEHPYDPEYDDYDVPAFNKPIETTKATAIYNMHTYWSKKPHDAIRQYIAHYTQPGDLVLDPFCGSGGTALAALMDGRKAVAIDRSPAATFIAKNYCTPVDVEALKQAFEELKQKVQPEIDWLYETRCNRCDGPATITYTVYSQVFQCPRCLERVPLFDCVTVDGQTAEGKEKKVSACPHCYKHGIVEEISTRSKKFGTKPVLVSYLCKGSCKPARGERKYNDHDPKKKVYFDKYDLGKLKEIEENSISYWHPTIPMIQGQETCIKRNLAEQGVHDVADLFTKRNLWALAAILENIKAISTCTDALLFAFTSILLKASRMMAHNNDGIGRIQKGTYYIPQLLHDIHVWQFLEEAIRDMIAGYLAIGQHNNQLMISTTNAQFLDMPNASVDYIFTDPPYADKVQYGELNFVWEAWLGFDTQWHHDEIIVNEFRGKSEADWAAMMKRAIAECSRVLKPGRCISICYHDTSAGTWALLQDLMAEANFLIEKTDSALYIDSKTKTTNQYFADKVTKRDLVINFRKPRPGELSSVLISGDEDETTFAEKVHAIIHDYLIAHPGATKDRVYDEVVSRMVRAGQMEAHNFDELLCQVAEPAGDDQTRWFVQHGHDIIDEAEYIKEERAARIIGEFIGQQLKAKPDQEGVHYSDIFEHFLYAIKEKPRRQLFDWLPDYFYVTGTGAFRLPATEEEREVKEQGRQAGINRHIKRYLAYIQQHLAIPVAERPNTATLIEWMRHCRRSGLYEQGRLLYERGGLDLNHLSDEQQVEVEEDYQICVRRSQVQVQLPIKTKPRKKKSTPDQQSIWDESSQTA